MVKYEELIDYCIQIIQSFNPTILTVDSHSEQFIQKHKKKLEDTEQVFIKQVFYGTFRYEEFLKIITDTLFENYSSQTNRNDAVLYSIFGYIICFRLDELPFTEFKKLVHSQEPVKMNVFLQFLFDIGKVNKLLREKWIQIYDISYIDNQIITQALEEKLPIMAELLAHLSQKATGKKSDLVNSLEQTFSLQEKQPENQKKKDLTVPVPFSLTKPKPKALPEPIKIEKKVQANPVPNKIFKTNLEEINQKGKQRLEEIKKQVEKEYKDSKQQKFEFQLDKRPPKEQRIKPEEPKEEPKPKQRTLLSQTELPKEIKHNVAAILREDAKIKAVQEQEAKRLKDLEWNMRDSTEFKNWKQEMKYKEEIELLEHQQKTKIEMELAREAAMKAFNEKIEKNKHLVINMKEESKKHTEEIQKKKEDFVNENRLVVQSVLETRDNASKEIAKIREKNRIIAEETKIKIEEQLFKIKEEEEVERKKKEEIIRQIRELAKQPKIRTKGYDPTETMGYGLLEEMSIVQLRERLNEMKIEREIEREQRKETHKKEKDDKLISLEYKVHEIKETRQTLKEQKEQERLERKQKKAEEERRKKEIREKQLLEVHEKIANKKREKKREEDRLAKEYKEIKLKRLYMNANAAIVEELAWKGQEEGAEREIKHRQNVKLIDQEKVQTTKFKERKILANTRKQEIQDKLQFISDYDANLQVKQKENEILYRQMREDKRQAHDTVRQYELEHSKNLQERDTFKYKMSEISLSNAKTKLEQSKKNKQKKKLHEDQLQLPGPRYDATNPITEHKDEEEDNK